MGCGMCSICTAFAAAANNFKRAAYRWRGWSREVCSFKTVCLSEDRLRTVQLGLGKLLVLAANFQPDLLLPRHTPQDLTSQPACATDTKGALAAIGVTVLLAFASILFSILACVVDTNMEIGGNW